MSPTVTELEKCLTQLVVEHRALLAAVQKHVDALRTFALPEINAAADVVEKARGRIVLFDNRRKQAVLQIIRTHKLPADVTLSGIAEAVPLHRKNLTALRDELRSLAGDITAKNNVSAKVAATMMGHLNTVVRLVSGTVRQAAVYTKQGQHTIAARVGVMEAVA